MSPGRPNSSVAVHLAVALGCGCGAVAIAVAVLAGETESIDAAVRQWFERRQTAWLDGPMRVLTATGSLVVLTGITVIATAILFLLRRWRDGLFFLLVVLGGEGLHIGLKAWVGRTRPEFEPTLLDLHAGSFPSGHAMMSMVVSLMLAVVACRHFEARRRVLVIAAAVALSLAIGTSRLYAGVHYASDVLAGWLAGLAWVMLCNTPVSHLSSAGPLRVAVPAALSVLRLILAAAFPLVGRPWQLAAAVLAGLSDGADGLAARRLGGTTWWGGVLDVVCDKLFTTVALVTLAVQKELAIWQVLLLLTRDLAVVYVATVIGIRRRWSRLRDVAARVPGKTTTFALFVLLAAVLAWPGVEALVWPLFAVTAALSLLSAVDYLRQFGSS